MDSQKRLGFIGAGKVGFSLGKYFVQHQIPVVGYYSKSQTSASEAAAFTDTTCYQTIQALAGDSDVIFLTVPDGWISDVWKQLQSIHIRDKIVCHCSGAMASDIFSDIDRYSCYGYSIHPLFAIHDRYDSYKELSKSMFTIEGHPKYLDAFLSFFQTLGNACQVIPAEGKVRYHAAAAMASNLMVALVSACQKELIASGFSEENAKMALTPILTTNLQHIIEDGCVAALTGPLERGDTTTVSKHLQILEGNDRAIYQSLSRELLGIAGKKNPERNYEKMEELLKR